MVKYCSLDGKVLTSRWVNSCPGMLPEMLGAIVTVVGDVVMVISGLLTPDLGVWWIPTGGGDTCVMIVSDTQEVDMTPLVPGISSFNQWATITLVSCHLLV